MACDDSDVMGSDADNETASHALAAAPSCADSELTEVTEAMHPQKPQKSQKRKRAPRNPRDNSVINEHLSSNHACYCHPLGEKLKASPWRQMAAGSDDDTEPACVSQMLQSRLQQNRLSFLEPILKHGYNVSTWRSLGHLPDDTLYKVCSGFGIGTVSRLRDLHNQASHEAAAVEELLLPNRDFTDAEPECISRKLAAKLKGHSIECLSGVLASCDILSFEWLGRLSREEIEEVCRCALAQGFDVDSCDATLPTQSMSTPTLPISGTLTQMIEETQQDGQEVD